MTGIQLQLKFLQNLQNHLSKDLDIRTIDIQYYFDRGQEIYVDEVILNYKGQEELRRRLGSLLVQDTLLRTNSYLAVGIHPYSEIWNIPIIARHVIDERVEINSIDVSVKPVTNDYYNKQITNPYKKPYKGLVWRMDAGGVKHELIKCNNDSITKYFVTHIKNPTKIDITNAVINYTEIPEGFQNELVDKAILFALDTFQKAGSLRVNK